MQGTLVCDSLATVTDLWKWARSQSHVGKNHQVFQLLLGSRPSRFPLTAPQFCLSVTLWVVPVQLQSWTQAVG